jgi:SPP1 gp7 family putative phage head morphogenesis protein
MASARELTRIVRESGALADGAIERGTAAIDVLARDVLAAVRAAGDLDQVRAALRDPLALVDRQALGALLSTLLAALVSGDLLGRAQVARQARAARVPIAPVDQAFPGQGISYQFAEGDPIGVLDIEPLPPEDAIRLFRDKVPLTRSAFDRIVEAYRGRAFTIAKQETVNAVSIVQELVDTTLAEGLTFKAFREGLEAAAEAGGIRAVNPYHARTVFETNVQTAYNAGRYEMYHAPEVVEAFPLFEYHTVGDARVRATHAAMNGFVARRDDPVWSTWWPPAGFNCRCTVTAISTVEADRDGIRPRRKLPTVDGRPVEPDPGFSGNAALAIRTAGLREAEFERERGES